MTIEANKVYSFKMISGEEIIAKVNSIDNNTISITSPLALAAGPKGLGMIPALQTVDPNTSVTLNTSAIALYAESDQDIQDKVLELTTGITVPPQKKILVG